jgi:hypothetical protein
MAKKRYFEVIYPNFKVINICGMSKSGEAKLSLGLNEALYHDGVRNGGRVRVKFTLGQATKVQRGSRCIALLFLQPRR